MTSVVKLLVSPSGRLAICLIVLLNLSILDLAQGDGYQAGISFSLPFPSVHIYAKNTRANNGGQSDSQSTDGQSRPSENTNNQPADNQQSTNPTDKTNSQSSTETGSSTTVKPPTSQPSGSSNTNSGTRINKSNKPGKVIVQIGTVESPEALKGLGKEIREMTS